MAASGLAAATIDDAAFLSRVGSLLLAIPSSSQSSDSGGDCFDQNDDLYMLMWIQIPLLRFGHCNQRFLSTDLGENRKEIGREKREYELEESFVQSNGGVSIASAPVKK
ncbi:hypothetical protein PIB30_090119 [Stylosanthes scabra]|uniref:Uncharacterized protein n=1 Tax=Stylosanthes scabra TaxID=79078 RepID=A0ABU6XUF7_9FABA|nr:hypothetical protein [Stylosanthes scabra]